MRTIVTRLTRVLSFALIAGAATLAQHPGSDRPAFRELFRDLIETNTTLSAGSCTVAAEKMGARLRAAGLPSQDVTLDVVTEHP